MPFSLMRARGAIAAAVAIPLALATACPAAVAYQVPSTAFSQGSTSAVGTMPGSGLTQTISTSGRTVISAATTAGSRGSTPQTYDPQLASSTPSQEIRVNTGDCNKTGSCSNRGTVTITFSRPVLNPIVHIAGIGGTSSEVAGGQVTKQSELHSILTLATSGITLSKASTGDNFALKNGTTITATDDDTSSACDSKSTGAGPPAKATAACGSVLVNGTVTSLTFNVTAVFTKNAGLPAFNASASADAVSIVASVREDFGDAPASYDAGDAARTVLGNVKLGARVSEDNANIANDNSSPNTSGDAGDDGVTLTPLATTATSYATTVVISGATESGQVCGWIDFDRNGTFDSGERACAPVTAGQTSATLNWTGLSGLTAGSTYARFRVGHAAGQVQKPTGASDSGEVEDYPFTIAPPDPPAAAPDTGSTPQDVNVTVSPLSNDKAGSGAVLVPGSVVLEDPADGTYQKSVTIPGDGTYTVDADGTVAFDPLPEFTGTAAPVGYRVADDTGRTATSTITVTVTPVKPEAADDTDTTQYDTPVTTSVLTNDKPGHPSAPLVPGSVCIVSGNACAKKHTVAGEGSHTVKPDGTIAFDPVPGFAGKTTPITYRVADDNGTTDTATLTITVEPPAPPVAKPDTGSTPQNVDVTVSPLTNDTAGTGTTLEPGSVVLKDPADGTFKKTVARPGEGTYTVKPDGTVEFDPLRRFTGQAAPVGYRVSDSFGQPATSTITITVIPIRPTATDDAAKTAFNTPVTVPVLGNDKAGDPSAPLAPASVCIVGGSTCAKTHTVPNEGTHTVSRDGTIAFDPVDGFQGVTTPVTYRVKDDNGTPAEALLTVTVGDAPDANPDTKTTKQNVNVTVHPLTNDKPGTGGTLDPKSVEVFDPVTKAWRKTATVPGEGTYSVEPQTGRITFDPETTFTGQSEVPYRVTDSHGNTAASTITITVTPIKPTATDDTATTPYNTPVTVPVARNDKPGSPEAPLVPSSVKLIGPATGNRGAILTVPVPGEGSYRVNPDGTVRFTPENGYQGTTTPVVYEIKDSNGTSAKAKLTITVGDRPTAMPDRATTKQGVEVTLPVLVNDRPGTGAKLDPATVRLIDPRTGEPVLRLTVPGEGLWIVHPDGTLSFRPEPDFTGTATPVRYEVEDSNGNPARSTATVTVDPAGAKAEPDSGKGRPGEPVVLDPLANDTPSGDAKWKPGSVCLVAGSGACVKTVVVPDVGAWTVGNDGRIWFVSDPDFRGTAKIPYRVTDTSGVTVESTAEFKITGEDDLPETGGPLALLVVAGALLVATGGALVALARRRRTRS